MLHIGLDAGSVSVKLVVMDPQDGNLISGLYEKHHGHPVAKATEMLSALPRDQYTIALTGSAGSIIADTLGVEPVNEIVAQAFATSRLHPDVTNIIEMGGEDSKLIILGQDGSISDFSMNSVCAAGTGSFLDQQGQRLNLSPEEMSELALKSQKPPRIAGRCSVFAKSDMIHLQQIATPVHDIVSGLCFAVARNFKGSILKGRLIKGQTCFQGGVAANLGMRRAFREVLGLEELIIPKDFALMGAMGAALKTLEEGTAPRFEFDRLASRPSHGPMGAQGHAPLRAEDDSFYERHIKDSRDRVVSPGAGSRTPAYMGVDIGSISTNLAVVDPDGNLLAKRYLMTAGRPIEAVRQGLSEIEAEVGQSVEILGVGTTGSGRYMIADYIGADIVRNEITAQATAAAFIDPRVDTIFEIGGQDSKYISLRDGVIVDFEMNKACAAGTGSFLQEQAEKLNIPIKLRFAEEAFSSHCPSKLGERCTVFMENSLMANLKKGTGKNDLLAGLAYSIVQNYINRVVDGKHIGSNIFFQGGVAFNKSVVAAFEKHLSVNVTVPDNHDVTGAIGMALIAMKHMKESGGKTTFAGFEAARVPYEISSFGCKSCSNMCEINTVKVEGRSGKLYYGGRCEKYDINRKDTSHIPDLFKFRDEALRAGVTKPKGGRPLIGIPYVFFMNECLPFFTTLLNELGLDMLVSPKADRSIVDSGLQSSLAETCYPIKVALGHVRHLKDKGVDAILLPSFINLNPDSTGLPSLSCPHTQSMPYVARAAVPGIEVLAPRINLSRGQGHMIKELRGCLRRFGIGHLRLKTAIKMAWAAQEAFLSTIRTKGREVINSIDSRTIAILGRSYNALESSMNLQIPSRLSTLNVLALPQDMLPVEDMDSPTEWPNMYWLSGKRIIRAAEYVRDHEHLYPILIGNFSCGPDSFILKHFRQALGGKPFLHIEIDEHSADAGAVTRCEAFLDSIENHKQRPAMPALISGNGKNPDMRGRKIYIPRMADHAFALAAAFERSGIEAEVLPEPTRHSAELGMKYTSGKECYPCILTTGEIIATCRRKSFNPDRSAFFMPSGSGPCRFGQYNVFHKSILNELGHDRTPVLSPSQNEDFYRDLGMMADTFSADAWRGVVAIELLYKSLRHVRPYAINKIEAEGVYERHLDNVYKVLISSGDEARLMDALMAAREDFEGISVDLSVRKPLIGIVGEIYVRLSRFSNEDLVRKIEDMGGEVWLSPFEEWIYYLNEIGRRKALLKRDYSGMIGGLLKHLWQGRTERRLGSAFAHVLSDRHEPSIKEVLRKAAPYIDDSLEGEAVLSVGKAVDLIDKGADGIVNAMPFGCMPGTISSALLRSVQRDFGAPSITVPYDGTESQTTALQLEAFMDQARGFMRSRQTMQGR